MVQMARSARRFVTTPAALPMTVVSDPDQSPTVAFSPTEISVLERLVTTPKPIRPARQPLTLRDAVRAMAKLGGFLSRKSHCEPGVKTWWRGYRQWPWLCWWDEVPRNPS